MVTNNEPNGDNKPEEPIILKKTTKAQPTGARKRVAFKIIMLLAVFALLGLILYTQYQINELRQSLNSQSAKNKSYTDSIEQIKQQESTFKTELNQAQQSVQALDEKVQKSEVTEHFQKEDWSLYKTRSLLELAQMNAHWTEDPKIAMSILQNAFESLKNIKSPKIFELRQSISEELAELKALQPIDLSGLLSQLDALQNRITELPLAKEKDNSPHELSNLDTPSENFTFANWRSNLQKSLQTLSTLVVVTHHESPLQPMLTPLERALIRESIKMNLQEAQWAALRNNATLYQDSLKKAQKNLNQVFDKDAASTKSLLQQLHSLELQPLSSEKPTLTKSLNLINQIIDSKDDTSLDAPAPTPEGEKTP